ncbi:hypothetical protein GCM10023116_19540 [Kistimonas scapharcae]|uniref:C2H2-type domain-containing protein n=1 Tax=Kistimonas scapharcae TaxID=1036133 RepID=A0ABP8V2Z5_9GAMM
MFSVQASDPLEMPLFPADVSRGGVSEKSIVLSSSQGDHAHTVSAHDSSGLELTYLLDPDVNPTESLFAIPMLSSEAVQEWTPSFPDPGEQDVTGAQGAAEIMPEVASVEPGGNVGMFEEAASSGTGSHMMPEEHASAATVGLPQPELATRTGRRNFVCEECPRRFATKNSLAAHRRTHTKEVSIKCGVRDCGATFNNFDLYTLNPA